MAKLKGKDLTVAIGTTVIAASKSCTIKLKGDTIEIASPSSSQWREYIAGRTGWSVSCDSLCCTTTATDAISKIGTKVGIMMEIGDVELTGSAIITDWTMTGSIGEMATSSIQMQGTGPLI